MTQRVAKRMKAFSHVFARFRKMEAAREDTGHSLHQLQGLGETGKNPSLSLFPVQSVVWIREKEKKKEEHGKKGA